MLGARATAPGGFFDMLALSNKMLAAADKTFYRRGRYIARMPTIAKKLVFGSPRSACRIATRRPRYRSAISRSLELTSAEDKEQSAESLLMAVYLTLCLQPRQRDGTREATVVRCGSVKITLRETEESWLPLWLELVEVAGERSIDGAGFKDVVDGVPHLLSFLLAAQNGAASS